MLLRHFTNWLFLTSSHHGGSVKSVSWDSWQALVWTGEKVRLRADCPGTQPSLSGQWEPANSSREWGGSANHSTNSFTQWLSTAKNSPFQGHKQDENNNTASLFRILEDLLGESPRREILLSVYWNWKGHEVLLGEPFNKHSEGQRVTSTKIFFKVQIEICFETEERREGYSLLI